MAGPTVLISGAARGVGRATALAFLAAGWRVSAGVRDLERARADLGAPKGLTLLPLDVTEPAQVREAVARSEAAAGGALACLVNNAAYAVVGAQEDADLDAARRMFETNVWGPAALVQAALPGMRRAGRGVVVNVSSIGGRIANPLVGFYHASKYALSAMSEALAIEAGRYGVRVALIEPGMVATDFPRSNQVTGSVAAGEGPYAELLGDLRGGLGAWRERPDTSSAEDVAAAIVRAATDPGTPFRVLVGGDAEELDRLRAGAADDLAWQRALRKFMRLDWAPPTPRR